MLELKNITKDYKAGDTIVHALKGINITFREYEFVSILGPSGCGKTTLLNIIGGLDKYTQGDLIINGKSTKQFHSRDWDTYRNHRIGFIFQNYNLIPHQTILANVELALTLSGISKSERRIRAKEVLNQVGLGDQLYKKPNQLSGGQMQRVAIARALINDPDILLADEPTGALDTETSIQIMNLLKEISHSRLIIMVTHNPDLAKDYSNRIIKLLDGNVIDDSKPVNEEELTKLSSEYTTTTKIQKKTKQKQTKSSMSFFTALSLSFNNLLTKKGRTILTSFAGSIGIIGIALILSLSNGIQDYIDRVQQETLSAYPINLVDESFDLSSILETVQPAKDNLKKHKLDKIYSRTMITKIMESMITEKKTNNLSEFKKFLDSTKKDDNYVNEIQYKYNVSPNVYMTDTSDTILKVNPSDIYEQMGIDTSSSSYASMLTNRGSSSESWVEMIDNKNMLKSQYDVIAGHWPNKFNEVILVVSDNNEISDITLYALGIKNTSEFMKEMSKAMKGEEITHSSNDESFQYEDILDLKYKLVLPFEQYKYNKDTKLWEDKSKDKKFMIELIEKSIDLKIVGIIRPKADSVSTVMQAGTIGFTSDLTKYIVNKSNESKIVKNQKSKKDTDIFTGIKFDFDAKNAEVTAKDVKKYIAELPKDERAKIEPYISQMNDKQLVKEFSKYVTLQDTDATYDGNLDILCAANFDKPREINIYAKDFKSKEKIEELMDDYNNDMKEKGKAENVITDIDMVGIMMDSVSNIIDIISYVLIAFVSISLVVSSIMIGIITYISVLERTKEIGILRSIGASKKDVSRVFNAETLIIGFVAGAIGIGVTLLLNIPANIIIKNLTDIDNIAKLPPMGGIILVLISMVLTFIAGLIPSSYAAKKDPVIALRSE